ncbi:MAG: hypothetical protein AVDCRST_MAG53-2801, partial [uncultured Solirubrobacteraceae bacterium]
GRSGRAGARRPLSLHHLFGRGPSAHGRGRRRAARPGALRGRRRHPVIGRDRAGRRRRRRGGAARPRGHGTVRPGARV